MTILLFMLLALPLPSDGVVYQRIPPNNGSTFWTVHCMGAPADDGAWFIEPTRDDAEQYCIYWQEFRKRQTKHKPKGPTILYQPPIPILST